MAGVSWTPESQMSCPQHSEPTHSPVFRRNKAMVLHKCYVHT